MAFDEKLREYARLTVRQGVNVSEGIYVVVRCPIIAADFGRMVMEEAFACGAKDVIMLYSDAKDIHDWALSAFTWALGEKLIAGKAGDLLDPLATATRAEVAVIMQNFVNLTK